MRFSSTSLCILLSTGIAIAEKMQTTKSTKVVDIGTRRPEGVAAVPASDAAIFGLGDGTILIRGEISSAGIQAVNVDTGDSKQIVNSTDAVYDSMLMAVHYHRGMIWAAGGGPQFSAATAIPEVRLYDPQTGALKLNCTPNAEAPATNFMNDMAFVDGKVYVTNSFRNSIMILDEEAALNGQCVVDSIDTPIDLFPPTEFGANGKCRRQLYNNTEGLAYHGFSSSYINQALPHIMAV